MPRRGLSMSVCNTCRLHVSLSSNAPEEAIASGYYDSDYHRHYLRNAKRKLRTSSFYLRLVETTKTRGKILDVGCSLGYFVEAARRNGWDAYGVEPSADVVANCRERGLEVIQGDMSHIDFPDETFDVVHLKHVLEHDSEIWLSLEELRRVLKPGGLLVVEVPLADFLTVRLLKGRYARFWKPEHEYVFSNRSIRNVLNRSGFEEIRMPLYGSGILSRGLSDAARFVLWRSYISLKGALKLT